MPLSRNQRFETSPTYGIPHPDMPAAIEVSKFMMSLYDAAPEHIRKRDHQDGVSVVQWFYKQSSDPRPIDQRYPIPEGCGMPLFPWDVFGQLFTLNANYDSRY